MTWKVEFRPIDTDMYLVGHLLLVVFLEAYVRSLPDTGHFGLIISGLIRAVNFLSISQTAGSVAIVLRADCQPQNQV